MHDPFKNQKNEKLYKGSGIFLGAFVTPENYDYLKLYSLYNCCSLQDILNKIIENTKPDTNHIITELSKRAIIEYHKRLDNNENITINTYKKELYNYLKKRRIQNDQIIREIIQNVLNELENETKNNK